MTSQHSEKERTSPRAVGGKPGPHRDRGHSRLRARLGVLVIAALVAGAGLLAPLPAVADGPATTLATKYGCGKVKDWALAQPGALFQAWAEDRILGDGQSTLDRIAKDGNINIALSRIGDMLLLVEILEEAAVAQDMKKVAQIIGGAAVDKLISQLGTALASGLPGAIWTTAKLLNDFAVALNAEILDLNVKMFANFADGDYAGMLAPDGADYFLREVLRVGDLRPERVPRHWKRYAAIREYAQIKLNKINLPPNSEWRYSNLVRSVINSMLGDVRSIVDKRKKARKLQGELAAQSARLKREVAALQNFQGVINAAKALVCVEVPDTTTACAAAVVTVDEIIVDAAGDVASIERLDLEAAREVRVRLTAFEAELDTAEARLTEGQAGIDTYCAQGQENFDAAKAKVDAAERLASRVAGLGPSSKANAAAACAATDLAVARKESSSARDAAGEASRGVEGLAASRISLVALAPPEALAIDPFWTRQGELHGSVEAEEATAAKASEALRLVLAKIAKGEVLARGLSEKCADEDGDLVAEKIAEFTTVRENLPDIGEDHTTAAMHRAAVDDLGTRVERLETRQIEARTCLAGVPDVGPLVARVEELQVAAGESSKAAGAAASRAEQCVAALEKAQSERVASKAEAAVAACKFDEAESLIAAMPPGSAERARLTGLSESKQAGETAAAKAYQEGNALYERRELDAALGKMKQARGAAQCEKTIATIDAAIGAIEDARTKVAGDSARRAEAAIAACEFKDAAALIAALPETSAERQRLDALYKSKAQSERTARAAYQSGKVLYREGNFDAALGKMREASGAAKCDKTIATIDAAVATIKQREAQAVARIAARAEAAIRDCNFDEARTALAELPEGSPERSRLKSMFNGKVRVERAAKAAFDEGRQLYTDGRYDAALGKMREARGKTACSQRIAAVDAAIAKIKARAAQAEGDAARRAEAALRACNFDEARSLMAGLAPGSAGHRRLSALMASERRAKANYDAAKQLNDNRRYKAALAKLQQARGQAVCDRRIAGIDTAIARVRQRQAEAQQAGKDRAREAEAAIRACDFDRARGLIAQLPDGTPERARLVGLFNREVKAKSYFPQADSAYRSGNLDTALDLMQRARATAVCRTTIARAEGNIATIRNRQGQQQQQEQQQAAEALGAILGAIGQAIGGGRGGGGNGTGTGYTGGTRPRTTDHDANCKRQFGDNRAYWDARKMVCITPSLSRNPPRTTGGTPQQCQGLEGEMRGYSGRWQSLTRQYYAARGDEDRLKYLACQMLRLQKQGNNIMRRYRAKGCRIPPQAFTHQGQFDRARAEHCG